MDLKKHVITGGPGSGKTTTVEALRQRGFPIIEEAARAVIEEGLRTGSEILPWKDILTFNRRVIAVQLASEARHTVGTVFADRGVIDNLAYCAWGKVSPPPELTVAAREVLYHRVFLLEPLPFHEQDLVRRESPEDARLLGTLIREAYEDHGYDVISVPPRSVQERVEFILQKALNV
ncbi:MAG: ATP-binding protein [Candidatus Aenigmarchaeota archaeon]|nr:ATP-binding protein [Candidatus Aenigmarchaeota archaeon]